MLLLVTTGLGAQTYFLLRNKADKASRKVWLRNEEYTSAGFVSVLALISLPVAAIAGDLDTSGALVIGGIVLVSAGVCVIGSQETRYDLKGNWIIENKVYGNTNDNKQL